MIGFNAANRGQFLGVRAIEAGPKTFGLLLNLVFATGVMASCPVSNNRRMIIETLVIVPKELSQCLYHDIDNSDPVDVVYSPNLRASTISRPRY